MLLIWEFASDDAMLAMAQRQAFTDKLAYHAGPAADLFMAAIVFGELVGNVVRHAPGPIAITLELDDLVAILTVTDRGAGFVFHPTLPSALSESGRGMFLIAQFAREVSVGRSDDSGHYVRVVLVLKQSLA